MMNKFWSFSLSILIFGHTISPMYKRTIYVALKQSLKYNSLGVKYNGPRIKYKTPDNIIICEHFDGSEIHYYQNGDIKKILPPVCNKNTGEAEKEALPKKNNNSLCKVSIKK